MSHLPPITNIVLENPNGRPVLCEAMLAHLEQALAKPDRFIVLRGGKPGVFCEGFDLETLASYGSDRQRLEGYMARYGAILESIETSTAIVIALIDGPARGGGLGLAAAADLALATQNAIFGLPETLLGLIPAMVMPPILRRVGFPRARWLALGTHHFNADEAYRIGLVDELVPDLEQALGRDLRQLAHTDARATAEVKMLLRYSHSDHFQSEGRESFLRLATSPETQARVQHFLELQAGLS